MQITKDNWQQMRGVEFTAIKGNTLVKNAALICGVKDGKAVVTIKDLDSSDPIAHVFCAIDYDAGMELFISVLSIINRMIDSGAGVNTKQIYCNILKYASINNTRATAGSCPL